MRKLVEHNAYVVLFRVARFRMDPSANSSPERPGHRPLPGPAHRPSAADYYHALFHRMDQGFCVLELQFDETGQQVVDCIYRQANPVFSQQSGIPLDVLDRSALEVMPNLETFWFDIYGRVALTGESERLEQYVPPVGRWFDVHTFRVGGPGSREVGVLFHDITARKQAEEALRHVQDSHRAELEQQVAARTSELQASRDLLHGIAEAQTAYVNAFKALRDESGRIVDLEFLFVNSITTRVDGGRSLVGRRYLEAFPEAENSGLLDTFRRVIETGVGEDQEVFYDDGHLTGWFRNSATPLGDGVLAIGEDITTRKQAELERARALHLLEQAEAVAGLGSWDYDLRSGAFSWSAGMYRLFGLPPGQPVHPDIYLDYVVDEDRPLAEQLVHCLTTSDGCFEQTLRLRLGEQVKTVRVKSVALPDAAGQPGRVLGVDLDITKLQRLEADHLRLRLTQQRALFEAVQAAQEEERKRMAESLHNGIGQILYATKLRLDELHTPVLDADLTLMAVRNEADQMLSEAIHQTRALFHELVPLVLEKLGLEQALQDIGRNMSTSSLRFRCQMLFDEEAAPLSPALQVALYRMAQELAQNIVKHAFGATEASLELETMPGWVVLRVEDNGPGFAPAAVERPGLGLRSIHDRVTLLEGQLKMGLRLDGGAYVRIRLPLADSRWS